MPTSGTTLSDHTEARFQPPLAGKDDRIILSNAGCPDYLAKPGCPYMMVAAPDVQGALQYEYGRILKQSNHGDIKMMEFRLAALVAAFCILLPPFQPAQAAELVVIQREETSQNLADMSAGGRFQTELGKMLAERMGRSARFLDLPRKRMTGALETGDGDILCGYLPDWLPGAFDWSRPFIPVVQVIISASRVQRPLAISDLKGKRIGTVLGFSYPELEKELGKEFLRDDGPSMDSSLRKLVAGRFDHMVTTLSVLNAHLKQGDIPLPLHPPLVVREFNTQCAVSRHGRIKLDELNKAIESLAKSGDLARLLQRYR